MFDAGAEFDRQALAYPALDQDVLATLRASVLGHTEPPADGWVPFVLVVPEDPYESVPTLTLGGRKTKPGVVDRNYKEGEVTNFVPIKEVEALIPEGPAYVLFDVQRGEEFCNVPPQDAMETIAGRGRTPITIQEGVALVRAFPEILVKNKCFMLGGSRCGDRRVPAIWISENAPKLGWCWAGNPHTWLGTASAGSRGA
ncbi:DUF5701 family protein [Longispora albida]|uniref:DUF5701 family protein n=1 Tax=Longispora albida TaxID=203523 RepID=UPI00036ED69E|nr:DUF5701 family protein [Longispora albida]